MQRRIMERYEEEGLGLPYPIVLINAAVEYLDEEGNLVGISVPNLEGLAAAVAVARAFIPVELDGREVRFMRKVIGVSAKEFAENLHMDPATFSRWEHNKQRVGAWADKEVRMATVAILAQRMPELRADMDALFALKARQRADDEAWPEIVMHLRTAEDGPIIERRNSRPEESWAPELKAA